MPALGIYRPHSSAVNASARNLLAPGHPELAIPRGTLPDEGVAGLFMATEDRPWSLELLGSVLPAGDPSLSDPNQPVPRYDVLYGASRDSTCLSLLDAWRSSFSLLAAIQDKEAWAIGWYAEGNAWVQPDDRINSIKIEYDLLSDWGWPQQQDEGGYDHSERTFRVPPRETTAIKANGARIELNFGWGQTLASHQYVAQAQSLVEIHDNLPLSNVRDKWVFPLQVLLEFLTLQHVDVKKVLVGPADVEAQVEIHYDVYRPSDLGERSDRGMHPVKMLATRSHLT